MNLERQLRAAKPEIDGDLTEQNRRILTMLNGQPQGEIKRLPSILQSFGLALVESPIPTLMATAAVLSFFLWQASILLGEKGHWISQAAAFLVNGGMLP